MALSHVTSLGSDRDDRASVVLAMELELRAGGAKSGKDTSKLLARRSCSDSAAGMGCVIIS